MEIENDRLSKTSRLYVDSAGTGRLVIPRLMMKALKMDRGEINVVCDLKTKTIEISEVANG